MLLLLYGKETYLVGAKLLELKEQARAKGIFAQEIDCKEANVKEVFQELNTSSLFNSKKFLIFYSPFGVKEFGEKEFQDALLKANSHTIVFVEKEPKKTDSFFVFLLKNGQCKEFKSLEGTALKNWLRKECKEKEISFAPGVDELLLASSGNDLERLSREIAKLKAFKFSLKEKSIKEEDVLSLVATASEPKIFSTIDAISAKDRKKATKLLSLHFAVGDAPLQLLSMFAWQFRTLLSIKDLQTRGMPDQEIAKRLKLHPFAAKKSFIAVQHFSLKELLELYKKIFTLDIAFKTSKGNPDQLLYLFLGSATAKEKQRL